MSPTTELIGHLATGTLSAVVGGGIVLLVTWDRQVGIARAEYRMNRAERQSEELLRAAMAVSDAVQPRAIEAAPDDHVTGELVAVDGVDTEADAPAGDTDRAGMWRVLLGLARELADRAWRWLARGVGYSIEWAAYLLKSDKQREAEFTETYQLALEQARDAEYAGRRRCDEEAPVNPSYKSRHVHPDFATGAWPAINAAIPTQRTDELCGHAYIGVEGEFTCDRYLHDDVKHWNSLAEFGWTDGEVSA